MSGFTDLRGMGVQFGPFDGPPPPAQGIPAQFEASWSATVELLARELRELGAEQIVIELADVSDSDFRIDGLPRSNARIGDPVRVSFNSRYGPLRYETGRFTRRYYRSSLDGWQCNIRAIALGLEALRKVDRYGITKRGEQYTGWKQLPASTDPADAIQTREQAWAVIAEHAPGIQEVARATRRAAMATHPDRGGDEAEFRKVQRAREVLGV
jgi:hypothetical protein